MARHSKPQHQLAYSAAKRFFAALRSQDSILTPGRHIWTEEILADFSERFIGNPQLGKQKFLKKFKTQLTGASPDVVQLGAELHYAHLSASAAMKGDTKRRDVREVLSWSTQPPANVDEAAMADLDGEMVMDQALNMRHPDCISYLARFCSEYLRRPTTEQDQIFADPWRFKDFAYSIDAPLAQSQREILLHMAHPDTFEKMSSRSYKERIAAFFDPEGTETDIDRRLLVIRERLTPQYGANLGLFVDLSTGI